MKKCFLCLAVIVLTLAGFSALAQSTADIPVIFLDGDCLNSYTTWNDKSIYQPATLTYTDGDESFTMAIQIKPQGTTSLYAPKKNFTIKFDQGVTFVEKWGAQTKYVLKADYIDPTCSGNVVSAKLAAEMNQKYGVMTDTPNYGVIDGYPVFVKINGEDAGIFNMTIPKDAWLFGMDESNPNHLVLACEGWTPACTLQTAQIDYETEWSFEVGEANDANKAAFERMVSFVCTADDATFVRDFDKYLDLDACLNYICFLNVAYASDNVAKNMLMVTYDGQVWYPMLYDLDSLWGISYDGKTLATADERWSQMLLSNGNCLLYRVNLLFGDQVRQRYWELREGILSKEHILESFKAYAAQIPQEYYDINNALWYSDGTRIRTVELMSQLMDEYLPAVDQYFVEEPAPAAASGDIHYVWEAEGIQRSLSDADSLPVSLSVTYTLDGQEIAAAELAGKSGKVTATLRAERRAAANQLYGVAALVQLNAAQCQNLSVTGGDFTLADQEYIVTGTAWLGDSSTVCELLLEMDVISFDPAAYMVVVTPVHIDGGDDSLEPLLATAAELTNIINDGLLLRENMTQAHLYLTNVQTALTTLGDTAGSLLPVQEEAAQPDAAAIMQALLADAEADADALLVSLGYELPAEAAAADRVQLLTQAAASADRTAQEQAQAAGLLALITDYQTVLSQLQATAQTVADISSGLTEINAIMPDLVGGYAYASDHLYAILYDISTLYQNLANYYFSRSGGGDDFHTDEFADWYDVIIFTNHDVFSAP